MKRNFSDSSARSTAGCLPVPLFNQKKRNRQPLTSSPLKNEPNSCSSADTLDFSAMLADFGWEAAKPEPTGLQQTLGTEPEEQNRSAAVWKISSYQAFGGRTENRKIPKLDSSDCVMGATSRQQNLQGRPEPRVAEKRSSFTAQWPARSNTMQRGLHGPSTSYTFKHNSYQQNVHENKDEKKMQSMPAYQLRLKEKDNSLRIISAVIESMKHWSQYTNRTPLLFEVLGTLDSAVTPGLYSAKTFLLRDGKESVSCVFYEIDRELPRLIRGRVHRCVGNYDAKRKLFKCVSIRPATVSEQQTFQDFVQIADVEMSEYVKTSNEV